MISPRTSRLVGLALAASAALAPNARAAQHITLANGFELDCIRQEVVGDRVRLFLNATSYMDVAATSVVRSETIPDPPPVVPPAAALQPVPPQKREASLAQPSAAELKQLLVQAGGHHNIDAELLASVVHAESAGQVQAVSRTGARGLMQLMPGTALALGVKDALVAGQNVEGGTKYLDQLLTRYHDNIALALAAYNAGPAAVDRFHGVPPYRETRAYVTRVIREFNRRKSATLVAQK